MDKYDYYVALITVTATEEAGLRYMYVPFEYSKEEWQSLIDTTKDWTLIDW